MDSPSSKTTLSGRIRACIGAENAEITDAVLMAWASQVAQLEGAALEPPGDPPCDHDSMTPCPPECAEAKEQWRRKAAAHIAQQQRASPPPSEAIELLHLINVNGILPGELQADLETFLSRHPRTKPGSPYDSAGRLREDAALDANGRPVETTAIHRCRCGEPLQSYAGCPICDRPAENSK